MADAIDPMREGMEREGLGLRKKEKLKSLRTHILQTTRRSVRSHVFPTDNGHQRETYMQCISLTTHV